MVTQRSVPPTGLPALPAPWMRLTDAGGRERGADYLVRGKARAAASPAGAGVHTFWVQGTHTYHVDIDTVDPLQSQCNCPHAQEEPVCKHMVAAWMACQASSDGSAPSAAAATTAPTTPPMPPVEAATAIAHRALARKTAASPRAMQLLQSMLERDMQNASSPYLPELQLVRHTLARMPDAACTVWPAGLHAQYGRKSNFLQGLDLLQR